MALATVGSANAFIGDEPDYVPQTICARGEKEYVCVEEDELIRGEELAIARILANVEKRAEREKAKRLAEILKEQAEEAARRAQCSVPLLWINCPAKKESVK